MTATTLTLQLGIRDTTAAARRNLLHILRTPQMLVVTSLQPATILILFRYLLGGAISVPGGSYPEYVIPAVFLEAVMIGSISVSVGLASDLKSGILDRLRTLPMSRVAILAGRSVADGTRSIIALGLMVALGVATGFRFHDVGPSKVLMGLFLVFLFGYAFSWVNTAVGLISRDPEAAQVAGMVPFFILMFASSAFVPVGTMPGWLQPFARNQPVTITLDAVRPLLVGGPVGSAEWQSIAWSLAIVVCFVPIALRLYRSAH